MAISGLSTFSGASGIFASPAANTEHSRTEDSSPVRGARHDHHHGQSHRRGRALGVFQQELRSSLRAHFHARFSNTHPGYSAAADAPNADSVATEALGAARQLAAASPANAARSLISFSATVRETASYVRETVAADARIDDVNDAVAQIDAGLAELSDEFAVNRESSASVLAIDTRTKQQSTLSIRTQEGDLVKLSLKQVDRFSASDVALTEGEVSISSTEISLSSRSRVFLKVDGDLNDAELAAIQNVFSQAEKIANEFFGGDLSAAFNSAEGFEFDAEQLARVNLRFRLQQRTDISYAEQVSAPPAIPAATPEPVAAESAPVAPPVATDSQNESADVTSEAGPVDSDVADTPPVAQPPVADDKLAALLESVSEFLRSVAEGFSEAGASARFHYSESFKLDLLRAVFHTSASEDQEVAAENADNAIAKLAATELAA